MIHIENWMELYSNTVRRVFRDRVIFIGLQGSYGRGEANENSDIDVVLILDRVKLEDLKQYNSAIQSLSNREKICGFVSGVNEIAGWAKYDLFQFYHDTISYHGNLDKMIPPIEHTDIRHAVLNGACNLYHMCSHNYLHSADMQALAGLYKAAVFTLQAKHYYETGSYIKQRTEMYDVLVDQDRRILQISEQFKSGSFSEDQFEQFTDEMLNWTSGLITTLSKYVLAN
ncbi:nucleotidyltransferase domain-containing protein [Paenibacillus sp. FSL H7-0326]|uniref:nucleotidyltransferase domain-containing protein n=1 Tax=Paenibacillus sp. FSL H7-0326 TaxID=1921144 RepID=UPI001C4C9D13|nr:nucleotidyltransferase domain-containing protein [Paenibacillus sp. FSL H7-0326]